MKNGIKKIPGSQWRIHGTLEDGMEMVERKHKTDVPEYNDIVERNNIEILQSPGDLTVRNGDIAVTQRGDLMLVDEDYSAFFRLVQGWRYNFPTLLTLFNASVESEQNRKLLEDGIDTFWEGQFDTASGELHHTPNYEAFHRANDAIGASEVARGVYAGSIAVVLTKMLQSFRVDIAATLDEWKRSGKLFGGCSIGQILEASANNVRHGEEWLVTRPPTSQQMRSIQVLSRALNEPLFPADGSNHKFAREISPETLQLISAGNFATLEQNLFGFAKEMLRAREGRLPSQALGES